MWPAPHVPATKPSPPWWAVACLPFLNLSFHKLLLSLPFCHSSDKVTSMCFLCEACGFDCHHAVQWGSWCGILAQVYQLSQEPSKGCFWEALGSAQKAALCTALCLKCCPCSNLHLWEGKASASHNFSKTRQLVKRSSQELKPALTESESLVTHLSRKTLMRTSVAFLLLPIFPCTRIQEEVCPHDQYGITITTIFMDIHLTLVPGTHFSILLPFGIFGQEPLN